MNCFFTTRFSIFSESARRGWRSANEFQANTQSLTPQIISARRGQISVSFSKYRTYQNSLDKPLLLAKEAMRMCKKEETQISKICRDNKNASDKLFVSKNQQLQGETYASKIQPSRIVRDVNDAVAIVTSKNSIVTFPSQSEVERGWVIPLGAQNTADSELGQDLIKRQLSSSEKIQILEDGCGNGQHLVALVYELLSRNISVSAIGTDIAEAAVATAKMFSRAVGIESCCDFYSANALTRNGPKEIWKENNKTLVISYRVLPCFSGKKILRYLNKMQKELRPGDLWCLSIALPDGNLYDSYLRDEHLKKERNIQLLPSSFGEQSFTYKLNTDVSFERLLAAFRQQIPEYCIEEKELSEILGNTYMTARQLGNVACQFGFVPVETPIQFNSGKNERLVVLLKRTDP